MSPLKEEQEICIDIYFNYKYEKLVKEEEIRI